jgi:hypothetical protein
MGFKGVDSYFFVGFLVFAGFFLSCSETPSRERFPGGAGRTTDMQRAETQKAVLGGFDSLNNQLPGSNSRNTDSPSGAKISGVIVLNKDSKLPEKYKLFISVRSQEGGPPLAAKRLDQQVLPYSFEISAADRIAMGGMRPFEGEVEVTVRIDQDGDPLSRQDGDLSGSQKAKIPQANLKIVLEPVI